MKYNLKYNSRAVMATKNKKFIRTVEYFNSDNLKIGSVETTYNDSSKNTFKVFDENNNELSCDVESGIEGRQFLVDRYEYERDQRAKGIARRILQSMGEQQEIAAIQDRLDRMDFSKANTDITFLLNCLS